MFVNIQPANGQVQGIREDGFMGNIPKRYLTLAELVLTSGLSASTIRRRVRDGSISAIQPGGHRTKLLFAADVLENEAKPNATTDHVVAQASLPAILSQPRSGRRPKWMDD